MAALPSQIGKGIIQGRLVVGASDSGDTDTDPDLIPAKGKVIFTPTITHIPEAEVTPELVLTLNSIVGILDAEGYLCAYDIDEDKPLGRGVTLFATDSGPVTDWTYTVSYCLEPIDGFSYYIPEHSIFVETGSTQNLANLVSVPSSEGSGTHKLELLVIRAEKAVRDSQAQLDTSATQVNEAKASAAAAASSAQAIEDAIQEVAGLTDVNVSAPIKDPSSVTRAALDDLYLKPSDLEVKSIERNNDHNLNDYRETGAYLQNMNAYAKFEQNYPEEKAGLLEVFTYTAFTYQRYQTYGVAGQINLYYRSLYNGAWYPWQKVVKKSELDELKDLAPSINDIPRGDHNLDTYDQNGTWRQPNTSEALSSRNYPMEKPGFLRVIQSGTGVIQHYDGYINSTDNRRFWRTGDKPGSATSFVWTPWKEVAEKTSTQWTNLPVDSGISKINDAGYQPVQYRAAHGRLDFRGSIMRTSSRSFGNTSTTIVKASSMPAGIMAAIGKDTAFPIVVEDSNSTTQIGRAVINNAGDLVFTFNVNAQIIVVDLAQLSFPLP